MPVRLAVEALIPTVTLGALPKRVQRSQPLKSANLGVKQLAALGRPYYCS